MGDFTLNQPLTVVLPMHNCERSVRSSVVDVLEMAQSSAAQIQVVVVDDGSTDETYETACELARTYPQVKVLRQPVHSGLTGALDLVRHRMSVDMVVAHDGITPVDASQLKSLLEDDPQLEARSSQVGMRETAGSESVGSRRFSSVRALHNSMEKAHRSVVGFKWLQLEKPLVPRRRATSSDVLLVNTPILPIETPSGMTPNTYTAPSEYLVRIGCQAFSANGSLVLVLSCQLIIFFNPQSKCPS